MNRPMMAAIPWQWRIPYSTDWSPSSPRTNKLLRIQS